MSIPPPYPPPAEVPDLVLWVLTAAEGRNEDRSLCGPVLRSRRRCADQVAILFNKIINIVDININNINRNIFIFNNTIMINSIHVNNNDVLIIRQICNIYNIKNEILIFAKFPCGTSD